MRALAVAQPGSGPAGPFRGEAIMIERVRIDRRWLPLNALRAFEGVARYRSFTGAASALNIAQSSTRASAPTPVEYTSASMPPSFAAHMMVPLLQDFRTDHPEVEIDLVSPYGIGPPAADVDIAVLYTRPTVTERVSDLLWPVCLGVVCHPDVAARHAEKDLESFVRDNELVHMRVEGLPRRHFWSQYARHASGGSCSTPRS